MGALLKWLASKTVYLLIFGASAGIVALFLLLTMDSFLSPNFGIKNIYIIFCSGVYLCTMVGFFFVFLKSLHDKENNLSAKSNKVYLKEKF